MQATQKPNLNIPSPQTLTAEELAEALGSDLQAGLTARKAKARLKLHGKNLIQREIEFRAASSFKGQLSGMINLLFLCAMLVLFLFSQETVYLLAMGVAFLLMLFGTGAELLASRIMRTQEKYSALAVRVIRDGKEQKVDSRLLVPGDLLLLSVGNLVPADARILEDDGRLTALETPVSGVHHRVCKAAFSVASEDEAVSANMLYAGTIVTGGSCRAMVCRTGRQTLTKQIHAKSDAYLPPLLSRMREHCRYMSIACILGCFVLIVVGILRGSDINMLFALSAAVGATSLCDSLLPLAYVSFGDGLRKLSQSKVVVRRFDRLARLASVNTVMCTKELTFPPKKLRLHLISAGGKTYPADAPPPQAASELLKLSLVCSDHPKTRQTLEQVVYTHLVDYCVGMQDITETWFRMDTAYNADGEVNAILALHNDRTVTVIKGAPENILSRCVGYEQDGKEYKLNESSRRKILSDAENAAKSNSYLVAIASGVTDAESLRSPEAERRMIFRGFLAFRISMEVDVAGGMYRASRAGIEAVVSTNDPYYTAASIGKSTGIIEHEGQMISSREIAATERGMFVLNAGKYKLFLEPTDEQWLDVLLLRKQAGRTVLATASSEEELPLLRETDVSAVPTGVPDALRESADVLMLESGFHVLTNGILGARMLISRLRWLTQYLTAGFLSLFVALLCAVLMNTAFPFRVQEILFGGIFANLAIACVLALLPTDRKLLRDPLPRGGMQSAAQLALPSLYALGNGILLYVLYRITGDTVCTMIGYMLSQFLYACGCLWENGAFRRKQFGYRALWLLFPMLALCSLILIAVPGINTALGFAIPHPMHLLWTALTALGWQAVVQIILFVKPTIKKSKKIKETPL